MTRNRLPRYVGRQCTESTGLTGDRADSNVKFKQRTEHHGQRRVRRVEDERDNAD